MPSISRTAASSIRPADSAIAWSSSDNPSRTEPSAARRYRAISHAVGQVADIVDTGARGGVHLDDIDMAVLGDGPAMNAFAAGRYRRRTGPVGADAIERAGDDPCRRGFADPAHARQDESLRDAALGDRVRQGADHRLLPDHLGKGLRPVFAGEDA